MRHAFDADHIAAIDNTTRKLMNDGQRPLGVLPHEVGYAVMPSKDSCLGR
jgi:high-affinity nickel permease